MIPLSDSHYADVPYPRAFPPRILQLQPQEHHSIRHLHDGLLAPDHPHLHVAPPVPSARLSKDVHTISIWPSRKIERTLTKCCYQAGSGPNVHRPQVKVGYIRAWRNLVERVQRAAVCVVTTDPRVERGGALLLRQRHVERGLVHPFLRGVSHDSVSGICQTRYLPSSTSLSGKLGACAMIEGTMSAAKDHPTTTIPPTFFPGCAGGMSSARTRFSRKWSSSRVRSLRNSSSRSLALSTSSWHASFGRSAGNAARSCSV